MTKRFTETLSTGIVTDNMTGKEYKCEMRIDDDLLELLNELHEENQALKSDRVRYEEECRLDVFKELHEENEQLKQAYTQLKHRHSLLYDVCLDAECERDSLKKDVNSLEKENEQLKEEIKTLRYRLSSYETEFGGGTLF